MQVCRCAFLRSWDVPRTRPLSSHSELTSSCDFQFDRVMISKYILKYYKVLPIELVPSCKHSLHHSISLFIYQYRIHTDLKPIIPTNLTMSDFTIKVNPASPETLKSRSVAMIKVEEMCRSQPAWYSLSTVAEYRKKRAEGLDGFIAPSLHAGARTIYAPSRDGHQIELRIILPLKEPKGVLLHFHAGA